MKSDVYITGLGLISALGVGKDEHLEHLWNGDTGIRKMAHLNTHKQHLFPAGEVPYSDPELYSIATTLPIRTRPLFSHHYYWGWWPYKKPWGKQVKASYNQG